MTYISPKFVKTKTAFCHKVRLQTILRFVAVYIYFNNYNNINLSKTTSKVPALLYNVTVVIISPKTPLNGLTR